MMISFQDFQKMELRVGKIEAAERVSGADKLLKLTVDIGGEKRTLAAGVAVAYSPEELTGKSVVVVTNLEPATIRGIRSEGMLLAGWLKGDESTISLVTLDRELPSGAAVS
ncbi:MAG: methionine--tRNA ligase subunit beta [Armatimonadetes bacterium]|nr:methionine--tRNA ligase subunit beta [Armatimonadota bacterium]NIM23208.1 methionine--tRNA ligase subunit beta [Armatimonadota bacterium]NIM67076.1 methionine--tRNA ligase subunit beta [Armatimonadota bacterium]NIM75603.1 methionine--tRNA ligase subunit beta [Armatimonadota bacterium]NIN05265.1 methionine--tRNA ligase subunit beta [Armatimonadota bacterium]